MLTKEVSQKYFENALTGIHKKRTASLFETSWALANGSHLTISSLGSHKEGSAYVKHKIKSVDRLVGNEKLYQEIPFLYDQFFTPLIARYSTLHILVDWSGCCGDKIHMLRASIVHNGRSITIYNEIHPQKKLGNPQVQKRFLAILKKMIPRDKKVVIITDAGFSTPWFSEVLKLGWDFIGRLTGYIMIQLNDSKKWVKVTHYHKTKSHRINYIGKAIIGKKSNTPITGNIYRYKYKCTNRKDRSEYPNQNRRFSKSYKTPWILATSLKNPECGGKFIINCYKNRMQIEQNFRDEKSPRFGFGWRFGRNKGCMKRIAVLCLIAHIAEFFLLHIGIIAEKMGLHKRFQVNTAKTRVLSLLTLARLIIRHGPLPNLEILYEDAFDQLFESYEALYL
jgi:hypothetical protein